jgi:excisionase family DNA binding protein
MAFGEKKQAKVESPYKTIEINAEMHGTLVFKEAVALKINGIFSGSLDVKGILTVGSEAQVEADINGDNVVIAGKVKGNMRVTKMLTLMPTAVLYGDIFTPKLNIVEGAIFQGGCHMAGQEAGDWMTIKELASYLELDESVINELVNSGKIPFVREGDALKFERVQIDNWAISAQVR